MQFSTSQEVWDPSSVWPIINSSSHSSRAQMLIIRRMSNVTAAWHTAFALKHTAALNLQATSAMSQILLFFFFFPPCVTACHECKYKSSEDRTLPARAMSLSRATGSALCKLSAGSAAKSSFHFYENTSKVSGNALTLTCFQTMNWDWLDCSLPGILHSTTQYTYVNISLKASETVQVSITLHAQ